MMKYSTSLSIFLDFTPMTTTITFGELDYESCADVDIINDNIGNEAPEVFEVNLFVSEQNKDGIKIVNPISMVTIIDDDTGMQGKIIKVFNLLLE